jgi:RND superfamily putative drug exporter
MSLERLARTCFRRRRLVLVAWLVALVAVAVLSRVAGGTLSTSFSLPGTESQRLTDLLDEHFPAQAGDAGTIAFEADRGVAAVEDRMEAAFAAAEAATSHVVSVSSPYGPGGERQISESGDIAFAQVQFDSPANELSEETVHDVEDAVTEAVQPGDGLTVEFGGQAFAEGSEPSGSEVLGLVAAVIILLVAFGSVLAMGLPIVTALFGVGIGLSGIALVAHVFETPDMASLIAAMIGIGVGIDYALFIVTRYRNDLHAGATPEDAVVTAITTAGRAVLFAGVTVIISLLGMFFMGLSFLYGLAVSAGLAVLVTMAASITLLPAMLGFCGRNIDRLSVHRRRKHAGPDGGTAGFWWRWSRQIQRRPLVYGGVGLVILVVLALPVFGIRLGLTDAGNQPTSSTNRRAYDLLSDGFGPGYNAPFTVAANFDSADDLSALQQLNDELAADPGVASVTPPVPNDRKNPTAAVIQVHGRYEPQAEETDDLVHRLRDDVIAPFTADTGIDAHSGGPAALGIDMADKLAGRLPIFFGMVIFLSFLLLMAAFRSLLVPLKAAIMNLLAIGASFGLLVAVFQWGWGIDLIGVGKAGPIAAFSPMMAFAILFGLSMDYEVFLLSRIKEEHDRTGDNASAVADGLGHTARVITAAAAIMVTVFFSFVFTPNPQVKLIGLGLGAAILLDATLVRMVLVPSTMELLGEANWWLPRWLDRLLPRLHIEGPADPPATAVETDGDGSDSAGGQSAGLPTADRPDDRHTSTAVTGATGDGRRRQGP